MHRQEIVAGGIAQRRRRHRTRLRQRSAIAGRAGAKWSHSRSFDQRRRPDTLLTAMATAGGIGRHQGIEFAKAVGDRTPIETGGELAVVRLNILHVADVAVIDLLVVIVLYLASWCQTNFILAAILPVFLYGKIGKSSRQK
jgi:hypothetical protein